MSNSMTPNIDNNKNMQIVLDLRRMKSMIPLTKPDNDKINKNTPTDDGSEQRVEGIREITSRFNHLMGYVIVDICNRWGRIKRLAINPEIFLEGVLRRESGDTVLIACSCC